MFDFFHFSQFLEKKVKFEFVPRLINQCSKIHNYILFTLDDSLKIGC
jgi:hypothetical protein